MQLFTLIFLFVFLYSNSICLKLLSRKEDISCPTKCKCSSTMEVNCQNCNFTSIPEKILSSTEKLNLGHNAITTIDDALFHLENLIDLNLTENKISKLQEHEAYSFKHLRSLDLSGNNLNQIPKPAFKFLKRLKTINLSQNPMLEISAMAFVSLRRTLSILILNRLSRLSSISKLAFAGLRNLKILRINRCQLTEVPFVRYLRSLIELSLSSNKIRLINSNAFIGANQLTRLFLSYNQIDRIQPYAFSNLPALEFLDMSGNKIKNLNAEIFFENYRLEFLLLKSNPWSCDCNLTSSVSFLSRNSLCNSENCPLCWDPVMYRNVSVTRIRSMNPPLLCFSFHDWLISTPSIRTKRDANANKTPCRATKQQVKGKTNGGGDPEEFLQDGRYKVTIRVLDHDKLNFTSTSLKDEGYDDCNDTVQNASNEDDYKPSSKIRGPLNSATVGREQKLSQTTTIVAQQTKPFNQNVKDINRKTIVNEMDTKAKAVAVGCFTVLTILAACFIILYYKCYKSSSSPIKQDNTELQSSNRKQFVRVTSTSFGKENSLTDIQETKTREMVSNGKGRNSSVSRDPSIHCWIGSIAQELEKYDLPPPILPTQPKQISTPHSDRALLKHYRTKSRHRRSLPESIYVDKSSFERCWDSKEKLPTTASLNKETVLCRERFQSKKIDYQTTGTSQMHQNGPNGINSLGVPERSIQVPGSICMNVFPNFPKSFQKETKKQKCLYRKNFTAIPNEEPRSFDSKKEISCEKPKIFVYQNETKI